MTPLTCEALNPHLYPTELVTLSACETGLGELRAGEGVYGLQRAFQLAGARNVIMSLAKVDDQATLELMDLFYTLWLGGMDKRAALLEAKRKMEYKYNNRRYWGAFIMIGL